MRPGWPTRCPSRRVYGITYSANDGLLGGWAEATPKYFDAEHGIDFQDDADAQTKLIGFIGRDPEWTLLGHS